MVKTWYFPIICLTIVLLAIACAQIGSNSLLFGATATQANPKPPPPEVTAAYSTLVFPPTWTTSPTQTSYPTSTSTPTPILATLPPTNASKPILTPTWTTSPTQTYLPTYTSIPTSMIADLPLTGASDICVLYKQEEALWIKKGKASPAELSQPEYDQSSTPCPPETLLPQIEVETVEVVGPITVTKHHLIPHLCYQHPLEQEVWFNTIRPSGYGRHYSSDLWRYSTNLGTVRPILADQWGAPFFRFSPDGQYVILASSHDIQLMRSDVSKKRILLEFPEYTICSEVNVWVAPIWLPDSSGVIVHIPPGCLHRDDPWPFGLWWIPITGKAASIYTDDNFPSVILDSTLGPRKLDSLRSVYWRDGMVYVSQEGFAPQALVALETLVGGYTAFLCP